MTTLSWLILAAVSLVFSALFSGVEIAYVTSDRVKLGLDIKKGGLIGRLIARYYNHSQMFISTILVGNNIVLVIYGMGAAALLEPWLRDVNPNEAFVLTCSTLISTLIILLCGEFFPKTIFKINPNFMMRLLALPLYLIYIILWPISAFASWLSRMLMRVLGVKDSQQPLGGIMSIGDLNSYLEKSIDEAEREAASGAAPDVETEIKMFHNALDFSTTQLRDCMLPRNEIVGVDLDETDRSQLSALFTSSGRSKIIVYRGDIDNVLGYIHVSELFHLGSDWKEALKPVLFAPETLLANKMMRRLLQEKRSLAIVVDEFGGTAGMVTLEDLVEEIFGDIRDEHDSADETAVEVSPGVFEFSGRVEIKRLNDEFRLDLPEDEDYQTLAGYILAQTGELPDQGATIEISSLIFTIKRRSATRLELIQVERPASES